MNTRKTSAPALRRLLRGGLLALGLAAVTGGTLVAPAFADEWRHGWGDHAREWREHEQPRYVRRDFRYGFRREVPRYRYGYGYVAPSYAPAPAYGYAAPFLSFSFR